MYRDIICCSDASTSQYQKYPCSCSVYLRLAVHVAMDNRVLPAVIVSRGAYRDFFFSFIKIVNKQEVIVLMYRV